LTIVKSIIVKNIFAVIFVVLLLSTLSGCDFGKKQKSGDDYVINLEGYWKFSIGDDTAWASPDYDDKDWEEIKVPSTWENEGYYGYDGFAWYRKTFEIPGDSENRDLYLILGYVDDADETYFNGTLIGVSGGFPPYYLTAYNALRKYYIPKQLNKKGKNTIAVRVYDIQLEGGIIKGPVGIYSVEHRKSSSSDLVPDINLTGTWKFETGDNPEWKEKKFNDSHWKNIFVPGVWEAQGFGGYDGFAWYRKTFKLPAEYANTKMVLLMGKIDDIDQTCINGNLIGETGDWDFEKIPRSFNEYNEWMKFRAYYIPDGILMPGKENTISVRVYDGMVDGGIYDGPIGLITQKEYAEYWEKRRRD
jgi:hypothetical protein